MSEITTTWREFTDLQLDHALKEITHRLDNEALTPLKRHILTFHLNDIHTEKLLRKLAAIDAEERSG